MRIAAISIRNFRSIEKLDLEIDELALFCGQNSCGKSNVFRAILLAFRTDLGPTDAAENLTKWRVGQGGPGLSIWVTITFRDVPVDIQNISGSNSPTQKYEFRLVRNGNVVRKLGGKTLNELEFASFRLEYSPVYVPPVRDLNTDGLAAFRSLVKSAMQRVRGQTGVSALERQLRSTLAKKGPTVLATQSALLERLLGVPGLDIEASAIDLADLFEKLNLKITVNGHALPLAALGTGHQSAVIMSLHQQIGGQQPHGTLFLFEEPDNHLHPSTARAVAAELDKLSRTSQNQVLVTTHSTVLLDYFGLRRTRALKLSTESETKLRQLAICTTHPDKKLRHEFDSFGLKLIEPLLVGKVIVVEGPTDRSALLAFHLLRHRMTTDQADVLVIATTGKDRVAKLCSLLSEMDVEWKAILDFDASIGGGGAARTRGQIAQHDKNAGVAAVAALRPLMSSNKRGIGTDQALQDIEQELLGHTTPGVTLDGSPLEVTLKASGKLTTADFSNLKNALKSGSKRKYQQLCAKGNVWLFPGDLEDALLPPAAETTARNYMVNKGLMGGAIPPAQYRTVIKNKLHGWGNEPELIAEFIEELEGKSAYRRGEMHSCLKFVFS